VKGKKREENLCSHACCAPVGMEGGREGGKTDLEHFLRAPRGEGDASFVIDDHDQVGEDG
jgi:hypothetical protein